MPNCRSPLVSSSCLRHRAWLGTISRSRPTIVPRIRLAETLIGSALMASRIYSETLHQLEREATPGTLLRHLHDFVRVRLATDGFFLTMAAVRFGMRGRRATFAAGGHPPAIHLSKGDVRLLESKNGILSSISKTGPSVLALAPQQPRRGPRR